MTTRELSSAICDAVLTDRTERLMLADALEMAGREDEAAICRKEWPLEVIDGDGDVPVLWPDVVTMGWSLRFDVANVSLRLALADALTWLDPADPVAPVQREIATLVPMAGLSDADREAVTQNFAAWSEPAPVLPVVEEFLDGDLLVACFDVRDEDEDVTDPLSPYISCQGRGDLSLATLKQRTGYGSQPNAVPLPPKEATQ